MDWHLIQGGVKILQVALSFMLLKPRYPPAVWGTGLTQTLPLVQSLSFQSGVV